MNGALLSSKNMGWCTPADFFSELDQEFHFNLDPAATDKSAKCARYFTPADDGLKADWEAVAVDNVKSYLMDALADIPNREQITIIA